MKKNSSNTLEVCCFSLKSCKNAEAGGADRIELCGGLLEGGTTPSYGLVSKVLEAVSIPVYVMIRPRGGDFFYNSDEIDTMLADIKFFNKLNPAGFVFGCLNQTGDLDLENMKRLLSATNGTPVTFHRAFDVCSNPLDLLEQLIELKIENILTSGQQNLAISGKELIGTLVNKAKGRIQIMVGSGVNAENINSLIETGTNAFHFTAKENLPSEMIYRNPNVSMGLDGVDEYILTEASEAKIRTLKSLIEKQYKM
jgi:copper homeostasis protein